MKIDRFQVDIALARSDITTYQQLAQRMGCTPQTLSTMLNRGTCNPGTLGKMARSLGVSVETIVRKEE